MRLQKKQTDQDRFRRRKLAIKKAHFPTFSLTISRQQKRQGVDCELTDMPDLFPILAVLCAHAKGESHLRGAAHLRFKESDRIASTKELLEACGATCEMTDSGLKICPTQRHGEFECDVSLDHRLAMAAAVAYHFGHKVQILGHQSVKKSFVKFWDIAQVPAEFLR